MGSNQLLRQATVVSIRGSLQRYTCTSTQEGDGHGAEVEVLWLSTVAVLLEDLSSVPSIYIKQLTVISISSSREPDALLWPPQAPTLPCIDTHEGIHICI